MKDIIRPLTRKEVIDYTRIAMHAFPLDKGFTEEAGKKKAAESKPLGNLQPHAC